MVSGFHGNTDPIMVLFLVLAAFAAVRHRPVRCGIFLALSCQIKIIPVLLVPVFLFFWNHRRQLRSFILPLALTTVMLWSEPLASLPACFHPECFRLWKLLGHLGDHLLAAANRLV